MLDLLVVGEVALDDLGGRLRPGGVSYSARAAQKCGLKVGMAGPIGMVPQQDAERLLGELMEAGLDISMVTHLPGAPLTKFVLGNYDEVEPQRLVSGMPLSRSPFSMPAGGVDTRSLLVYPVNPDTLHEVVQRWPQARLALDLQYDLSDRSTLDQVLSHAEIVFASSRECLKWMGMSDVASAAQDLLGKGPQVVVMKFGQGGSAIYRKEGAPICIPAYHSRYSYTIGAGDVYNAVFLAGYLRGEPLERCGRLASLFAGRFTESFTPFEEQWSVTDEELVTHPQCFLHPDSAAKISVYLAGPFFNQAEYYLLERVRRCLTSYSFNVFSPYHEVGAIGAEDSEMKRRKTFLADIQGIDRADVVIALGDGDDTGTAWECGYAHARGKDVVLMRTEVRARPNLMIEQGASVEVGTLRQLVNHLFSRFNEWQ